jgi:hypothetical protein
MVLRDKLKQTTRTSLQRNNGNYVCREVGYIFTAVTIKDVDLLRHYAVWL